MYEFLIDGEKKEIVESFKYLGVSFTYTGTTLHAVKSLQIQALMAYNMSLIIIKTNQIRYKNQIDAFW